MFRDLRFALRRLTRSFGFSSTVILLLGLALGASGCLFSVIYGLLFKPLPFANAERIVMLDTRLANMGFNVGLSVPFFDAIVATSKTLDGAAAYRTQQIGDGATDDENASTYNAGVVQPSLFALLGTRPHIGRLLTDEDAREGAAHSVVISWDFWHNHYAGAADAVGRVLKLGDGDYRIVGVAQRDFAFPQTTTQIWLPLTFRPADRGTAQAGSFGDMQAIARLHDGATSSDADGELKSLASGLDGLKEIVDLVGFQVHAKPSRSLWLGERRAGLELMLLAVALVLLVTTANIANLYIARLLGRRHELAVLDALCAGRWSRLRQTVAETLALCLGATAVGLLTMPLGLTLLARFDLIPLDAPQHIGIDPMTVAFMLALGVALALMLAACSLSLRTGNLSSAIKSGARQTGGRGAQRARGALIVAQIGLTAALLVGVGLLLRSSQRLLGEDVGFERDHLAIAGIAGLAPASGDAAADVKAAESARAALREFVERVRTLPGVSAVSLASLVPFGWSMSVSNYELPGDDENDVTARRSANRSVIGAEYFSALGVGMLRGRTFTAEETRTQGAAAIVDAEFAAHTFAGRDAIGEKIRIAFNDNDRLREVTIVGVAPTLKLHALEEKADRPTVFVPGELTLNGALLVRTHGDAALLAEPIRRAFHEFAPRAKLSDVMPMRERIARTLRERHRLNVLLSLLGAMTLTLAAVGLYAVLTYSVRMRRVEFGVRMAIGASTDRLLRDVLGQGALLVAGGLLLALPLGFALTRMLAPRLYKIDALDPVTLIGVGAVIAIVCLIACWLPARRASRVDPIEALRQE
jgi:putative ABC transport system permease protein